MLPFNLITALESQNRSLVNMNFGELLFVLDPEVRSLARRLGKFLRKEVLCFHGVVFNETWIKENLLPTYRDICIYIGMYIIKYTHLCHKKLSFEKVLPWYCTRDQLHQKWERSDLGHHPNAFSSSTLKQNIRSPTLLSILICIYRTEQNQVSRRVAELHQTLWMSSLLQFIINLQGYLKNILLTLVM